MSYSNTYQDYIRDIPMEIGRRFYPPPAVNLPTLLLPQPLKEAKFRYAFEAEQRARRQFDEANEAHKPEHPPRSFANGLIASTDPPTPAASLISELLQPCAAPPAPPKSAQPPVPPIRTVSFEEFEGRGTVFDELEWQTIDDREALSQILSNTSLTPRAESTPVANSAQNGPDAVMKPVNSLANGVRSATISAIPPYPVLDFTRSKSEEPSIKLSAIGSAAVAAFSKPAISVPPPVNHVVHPSTSHHESPLRLRLLTKGYRENLVNVALENLPRERLPHVEYYMKGMSILEKKGVDLTMTVKFLMDSCLTEKQSVIQRAHTAEQLIGMGFTAEEVFPALLKSQGDRVKALDTLLGSR